MKESEKAETSASLNKSQKIIEWFHEGNVNPRATATTMHFLNPTKFFRGDWIEHPCPDGTKVRILKNPLKAFEVYAKEWTSKFDVMFDMLEKVKITGNTQVQSKIVKLFENMNFVNAALREIYKNSYLTFAATPCMMDSQKEKRRMDRMVAAISLSLIGLKIMLEGGEADKFERVNRELIKLIDKLTSMLLSQSEIPRRI